MKKKLLPITLLCLVGLISAGCGGKKKKDDPKPSPSGEPTEPASSPAEPTSPAAPTSEPVEPTSSPAAPTTEPTEPTSPVAPTTEPTASPSQQDVAVTGVQLNKAKLELLPDEEETLVASVLPENATNQGVKWKSSDPDVAMVSKTGKVTALEVGKATITVTTDDGGFEDECEVIVMKEMNSLTITNKAEFANFSVGDNKALVLTTDPEINTAEYSAKGLFELESSEEGIVEFSGLQVYAKAAGTTTITVSLFGVSDSFELTVEGEKTAKELYGTVHAGTEEDPLDNADAVKVGKWVKDNKAKPTDAYFIKGIVKSFYHAPGSRTDGAVSYYLQEEEGDESFEVYKAYGPKGESLTDDDIWLGAEVLASGKITYYGNTLETDGAVFHGVTGGAEKPAARVDVNKTFAEVLEAGAALADGADSYDYFVFDAYVTAQNGSDYYLTATKGEELVKAKSDAAHGERDYYSNAFMIYNASADVAAKLLKDAKVTVRAVVKNYHGTVENLFALEAADVTVLEQGQPWVEPELEQLTVAQALAKIEAVAAPTKEDFGDKTSLTKYADDEQQYVVTGVVVKKGTWSSQYKNADFYIADTADAEEANRLQVFRFNDETVFNSLVVGTTTVKVTCKLAAYFKLNGEEITLAARETNASPKVEVVDGGGEQPVAEKITVAQAIAKINEVAAPTKEDFGDKTSLTKYVEDEKEFVVSGLVVKKGTWSDKYSNVDFYIADAADAASENQLQVFRFADKTVFDALVVGETEVEVTCKLAAYFKLNGEEITLAARETNAGPAVKVVGGEPTPAPTVEPTTTAEPTPVVTPTEGGGGEQKTEFAATVAVGSNAFDDNTVNGKQAYKCGTSKNVGSLTISVPAEAKRLLFKAGAWKGVTDSLALSIDNGTLGSEELALTASDVFTGSDKAFTIANEDTFAFEVSLELTGAASITVTAAKRFVMWDVMYSTVAA